MWVLVAMGLLSHKMWWFRSSPPRHLFLPGQGIKYCLEEQEKNVLVKAACECPCCIVSCCHHQWELPLYIIYLLLHLIVHSAWLLVPPVWRAFLWSAKHPFLNSTVCWHTFLCLKLTHVLGTTLCSCLCTTTWSQKGSFCLEMHKTWCAVRQR